MRRLAKGVLNPILPEDPGVTLTSPPEFWVGIPWERETTRAPRKRGRGRDRGRSNLSAVKRASPCSTFTYTNAFPTFIYPFISNWKNVIGDGNCGYRVVADFLFGNEHQWPEVPNAFNLCVILIAQLGSTTVLPLYSYSDRPEGTLVIGFLTEERHFIQLNDICPIPPLHVQWIHHHSEWVSNWADSYQHRITDWNARVALNRK
ncbi:hypothetical protein M9H77_03798 [Catharanthus roseus]|uniref:Uncharacterized protein n=1 Tax=Catharanthus roseus TaxID=4058 RepID=A0ACC0CCF0_CATRO|nr:hypothetical protein M9H77_03798 [Catharanthus roseus]